MGGDVERRFAVFLQLHCTAKVEFERGIFNRIHDVARLGQRAKSADFERSPALGIARSIVTRGEVCGGGGVTHKVRSSIEGLEACHLQRGMQHVTEVEAGSSSRAECEALGGRDSTQCAVAI
jgi:hypothetical protein